MLYEVITIALKPTDGLVRGAKVADTGKPISVPVGDVTKGHVFNVTGEILRITSYNVCYTKLLREEDDPVETVVPSRLIRLALAAHGIGGGADGSMQRGIAVGDDGGDA